jgi:hypothetical protein
VVALGPGLYPDSPAIDLLRAIGGRTKGQRDDLHAVGRTKEASGGESAVQLD